MNRRAGVASRFRASIFWRVFTITLLLFLVVAGAGGLAVLLSDHRPAWYRMPKMLSGHLSAELSPLLADPGRMRESLARIADETGLALTVYDASGARLASAGAAPLLLPPLELAALTGPTLTHNGFSVAVATPVRGAEGRRAVLLIGTPRGEHLHRVLTFVVMLTLLIMALSAVVAWDIARPLRRLKRQAEAFGAGELAARTDVRRGDEIGGLAATFNEMGGRIEEMVRREKQLLADISHEIRTPLARIRVAVELCAEEEGSLEEVRRRLAGVDGDLAELETLLADALTTFRLDAANGAGRPAYPLTLAPVELPALFAAAAERFRRGGSPLRLDFRLPPELPPIHGDAVLLRRVIENLLDNAAKYGDRSKPIEASAAAGDGRLTVEVADRGPGVAPEDLPRLFDPFFRSARRSDGSVAGLGLGLTLCRRIVEAHGGGIEARQRAGGGLVVRFTLPLAPAASPPGPALAFPEPAE